jgi:hypothetical protein
MKLTRKETIVLEMDIKDFNSLMYFLDRSSSQTHLVNTDAAKASAMYRSLREMNK